MERGGNKFFIEPSNTQITWDGPSGAGPMVFIRGVIYNVEFAQFRLNGDERAAELVRMRSMRESWFHDVMFVRGGGNAVGVDMDSRDCGDCNARKNTFERMVVLVQKPGSVGWKVGLSGATGQGSGNSKNVWRQVEVLYAGDIPTSYGFDIGFVDNNIWMMGQTLRNSGETAGCGINFSSPAGKPAFPKDNVFVNWAPSGGAGGTVVCGTSGTGGNTFWPLAEAPGDITIANVHGFDSGNFFGEIGVEPKRDEIPFHIKGHTTQTNPLFVIEKNDGTDIMTMANNSVLEVLGAGGDATIEADTTGSGDAVVKLTNNGNQGWVIRADRMNNELKIGNSPSPDMLVLDPAVGGRVRLTEGLTLGSVTHSNLPAAAQNGTLLYCSDCVGSSSPCLSGGTGTVGFRINGSWSCF